MMILRDKEEILLLISFYFVIERVEVVKCFNQLELSETLITF